MAPSFDLPAAYERLRPLPLGRALFSRGYRLAAPYFLTIPAEIVDLEPGRSVARMRAVPWTRNHLGTVHAIAQCNLAEFTMGAVAEATVPSTHRWIPRGMTIDYLAKAKGMLTAEAILELPAELAPQQDLAVAFTVRDRAGTAVSAGEIRLWLSAAK